MSKAVSAAIDDFLTVSGDAVVEDVRINRKGGSRSAILRKNVIAEWGPDVTMATGARLDFGGNVSGVLLAPQMSNVEGEHLRIAVRRVSKTRFVLDLCSDDEQQPGEVEKAFLRLLIQQFRSGDRELAGEAETMARLSKLADDAASLAE